jgi:YidC/Oxa1 family membrane protein insertase
MEERRLLLAVALSLLVVTAYQVFVRPLIVPPQPSPAPSSAPQTGATPAAPAAAPAPQASTAPPVPQAVPATPVPAMADERERRVEVQTAEAEIAFTNKGARPVAWKLTRYTDGHGEAEDMVHVRVEGPRALDFETGDPQLDERLRGLLFQPSSERVTPLPGQSATLTFRYADASLQAEKTLVFGPEPFLVRVLGRVSQQGRDLNIRMVWGPGLGRPDPEELSVQGHHAAQAVLRHDGGGSVERLEAAKSAERREVPGLRWAGIENTYFAALLVPAPSNASAAVSALKLPEAEAGGAPWSPVVAVGLPPLEPVTLFVGPKDHHLLAGLGHDFKSVVPVGDWIGPIVVALLGGLRWAHGLVGNYGWAIILLTVLISLVMAPFRHYSIVNGIKMAKLAPEMKVIQDRYRKVPLMERQQMQEEINALYAKHGMNMGTQMLVGCLPMLLTMPFFFAFYRMLSVSIDLRGAAFLWMPDLSHKDPLYLTPILMGASMVGMARLTPIADPSQKRLQMLMPLIFVTFLFAAPAGLNVYWLVSNLCGIAQQVGTTQLLKARAAAPAAPARKARKAS